MPLFCGVLFDQMPLKAPKIGQAARFEQKGEGGEWTGGVYP